MSRELLTKELPDPHNPSDIHTKLTFMGNIQLPASKYEKIGQYIDTVRRNSPGHYVESNIIPDEDRDAILVNSKFGVLACEGDIGVITNIKIHSYSNEVLFDGNIGRIERSKVVYYYNLDVYSAECG